MYTWKDALVKAQEFAVLKGRTQTIVEDIESRRESIEARFLIVPKSHKLTASVHRAVANVNEEGRIEMLVAERVERLAR